MLTLDLALITHTPQGIQRVADMNLPVVDGVRYIVSWQNHGDTPVPASLLRDDVEIHRFNKTGQSFNRNNALDHCTADIVLNSDDDLIYTSDSLMAVRKTFEDNPLVDVATFKADMPGAPIYPSESCILTDSLPKGFWVATFNIAFRRQSVGNLRFHPEFGLGSPKLHGAEDEFFLLSAIRRKLHCRYFPIVICTHPNQSTGTKATFTPGNLRAAGCYITIAYPKTFPARLLLKAWRISRNRQSGFFRALRYLISGATSAPHILHTNNHPDCEL